ncbi:MAG: hydroxymethylbilane synthase [Cyclobacteriaceae bacterium]|nr:hydroxymethylbilane synthase [Cyclobacteriaceae bacterium]
MKIRIGTRGSKLALWQAHYISDLLKKGGVVTEVITIETTGDKILDVSIAKIGSKGVFTEEIEAQLALGTIDIAVHSAKDLQSVLPDAFELIAFTKREGANDIILSHKKNISLNDNLVLGTSSTRRIAFLKHLYPHIKTVPVRGNLQTRIRKMEEGACDALMLAYAGAHRMGFDNMIIQKLSTDEFIPAVGQGSVAIECSTSLDIDKKNKVRALTNNIEAETCLLAERAYLRELEGGCSIPVFALATLENEKVSLTGGIISLNGKEVIKHTTTSTTAAPAMSGHNLAEIVLKNGGDKILKEIKEQIK